MRVVWADEARAHLAGIHDFIKRDSLRPCGEACSAVTRLVNSPRRWIARGLRGHETTGPDISHLSGELCEERLSGRYA